MKKTTLCAALSGAFLLGTAALVSAQTSTTGAGSTTAHPVKNAEAAMAPDYKADKERIESEYKSDKSACKSQARNAKNVCKKEAKSKEKIAIAEL